MGETEPRGPGDPVPAEQDGTPGPVHVFPRRHRVTPEDYLGLIEAFLGQRLPAESFAFAVEDLWVGAVDGADAWIDGDEAVGDALHELFSAASGAWEVELLAGEAQSRFRAELQHELRDLAKQARIRLLAYGAAEARPHPKAE